MTPRKAGRRTAAWAALALAALAAALQASPALAHAVYIFAWVEGDQVCTDSYFTRQSPVRGGVVTVSSADGTELDRAVTDDDGDVCFPRPAVEGDLLFVVLAGQGHRAQFTLRAEDMPPLTGDASDASSADLAGPPSPETAPPAAAPDSAEPASSSAGPAPDLEAIRRIVRQELAAQLGPINRRLTMEETDDTPTLKNIVGGLGWVFGIFGVAFWWTGRRRRAKPAG